MLDDYREAVLLHERLVPYIRAAAATAARSGLPVMRPLCLVDPEDPEGWSIADWYVSAPRSRRFPVLDEENRSGRHVPAWPVVRLVDRRASGRRPMDRCGSPLDGIPLWVRAGSLVTTYPAADVARGLGEEDASARLRRPSRPGLWARQAQLADGTRISWRRGAWTISADRPVSFVRPFERGDCVRGCATFSTHEGDRTLGRPLARALLVLTFTTGLVDAVSYLGLGHVFTANMTGNIVFLGFGIAGGTGLPVLAPIISLAAFLGGAAAGGRLASRFDGQHTRHFAGALGIEMLLIGFAAIIAIIVDVHPDHLSGMC